MLDKEKVSKLLRCTLEILLVNLAIVIILSCQFEDVYRWLNRNRQPYEVNYFLAEYWEFKPFGHYYLIFFAIWMVFIFAFMIKNYVSYNETHQFYFVKASMIYMCLTYILCIASFSTNPYFDFTKFRTKHSVAKIFIIIFSTFALIFICTSYGIIHQIYGINLKKAKLERKQINQNINNNLSQI